MRTKPSAIRPIVELLFATGLMSESVEELSSFALIVGRTMMSPRDAIVSDLP
jgi:hypothetical protein